MNNDVILEIKDLKKVFKDGLVVPLGVLKGINLTVKKGEFISLMGESGSGKSTLLYQIGFLDSPTEGTVLINGQDVNKLNDKEGYTEELEFLQNKTIKGCTYDLERMGYNTYISKLMILTNKYEEMDTISKDDYRLLLILLNPVAPHITEELNEEMGYDLISNAKWPVSDDSKLVQDTKEIAIQVNGKVRGKISININDSDDMIRDKALECENVKRYLQGVEIDRIMVIKKKIVTIVTK